MKQEEKKEKESMERLNKGWRLVCKRERERERERERTDVVKVGSKSWREKWQKRQERRKKRKKGSDESEDVK